MKHCKSNDDPMSSDEMLDIMYNNSMVYHDIEKEVRRNKRKKKGYKYN